MRYQGALLGESVGGIPREQRSFASIDSTEIQSVATPWLAYTLEHQDDPTEGPIAHMQSFS